ncbi:MAG: DUF1847 domain-containing protein [Chloroflexi bacterium]|nr:DUF1847 domain-containing protein [Chloroflexota bacterium]
MDEETRRIIECAKCPGPVCNSAAFMKGPENCPTQVEADVIEETKHWYEEPGVAEFARQASIVEGEAYGPTPWAPDTMSTVTTRLEEIIKLAKKMGYKKLGVAFCIGLRNEAGILIPILENNGFEVVSVCCKTGGVPKEDIGIKEEEKIRSGRYETMCNPIAQAEILNREGTEFNILVGLCVGHDALFLKYARALTTVFIVKDRVLAHNPAAALYLSSTVYYRRLLAKDNSAD